jgi:hypothetical protein
MMDKSRFGVRQGCLASLEKKRSSVSNQNKGQVKKEPTPNELTLPSIDGRRYKLDGATVVKEGREKI